MKPFLSEEKTFLVPSEKYQEIISPQMDEHPDVRAHLEYIKNAPMEPIIFNLLMLTYTHGNTEFQYFPEIVDERDVYKFLFDSQEQDTNKIKFCEEPGKKLLFMPVRDEKMIITYNVAVIDFEECHIVGFEPNGNFQDICRKKAETILAYDKKSQITFEKCKFISLSMKLKETQLIDPTPSEFFFNEQVMMGVLRLVSYLIMSIFIFFK